MASVPALPATADRASARAVGDAWLVGASCVHAALLLTWPSTPLIALGLWWNANTVAHNFIHRPFFRTRAANRAFTLFLSALLGVPQSVWRSRHLAHHADRLHRWRWTTDVVVDTIAVAAVWGSAAVLAPAFFVTVYLPGWAFGLVLCHLQGYFEHARGTTSHYGRLYNFLFFNDGYHVEHHARPGLHWTELPHALPHDRDASTWPPVLRWLEFVGLDRLRTSVLGGLEGIVLKSPALQRAVCRAHARACRRVLAEYVGRHSSIRRVLIVGGGLFPRTAIVLRGLLPDAHLTILDANADHLRGAASFLADDIQLVHASFDPSLLTDVDLVVIPLAFVGDRRRVYARPPARLVLVHDWLWSRHGRSAVVSRALLKRMNLVATCELPPSRSF